jgi:predicted metal-dependent phosphoesterase TrpH
MPENFSVKLINGDLHIHTSYEDPLFPGMDIRKVTALAIRRNIKVIAITNHDALFEDNKAVEEALKLGLLVIGGIEITARAVLDQENNSPHILGIGVANAEGPIPTGKTPHEVSEWIKRNSGLVVAPHTTERGNKHSLSFRQLADLQASGLIDAVEVISTFGPNEKLLELIKNWSIAILGSTDSHWYNQIGRVATRINIQSFDVEGVRKGILNNEVKPEPVELKPYSKWIQRAIQALGLIIYSWPI